MRKPNVTIIGPGRLGTALAIALSGQSYVVDTLVGRNRSKLKKAAELLGDRVDLLVLREIQQTGDIALITTPDDQLSSVTKVLSRLQIEPRKPPTAFHTSGAISSEILKPLAERGWHTASIHPLVSVSDPVIGAKSFTGAFWCIEGDREAVRKGRRLIRDLGGQSFSIKSDAKPLYHAAAVMSSGNIVAVFDVAIDMLSRCGIERSEARRILLPLLRSTVTNLSKDVPAKALTGTFSRGDSATVERHLAALAGSELKGAASLYRLLGLKSLKLAEAKGLNRLTGHTIARMLSKK